MDSLQTASAAKPRRLVLGLLLTALFVSLAFLATGQERVSRDAPAERAAEAKSPSKKSGILTSRPAAAQTPPEAVKVGDEIVTAAGQRRRLRLADGSILFVNQHTEAKLTDAGQLTLKTGEIYVELPSSQDKKTLKVTTPHKDVTTARPGSHFDVRVDETGRQVVVARGSVQVEAGPLTNSVKTGQMHRYLSGPRESTYGLPRLSQVLDWTRELMLAAESPLVPGSEHAGGALIAVDPKGQEAKLELRKFHVDVFIEDGFARTTIDQTYFNHEAEQLEGTFYFPLPPDASLSRLAMYVDGQLREGGMAERDLARQTYENFRYYNRDPALLEWVDGSTFKMRVFPIEARQEKRLVLSYSQRLPHLNGEMQYRFPAGHSLQTVKNWSFRAQIKDGKDFAWSSSSHKLETAKDAPADDLVLTAAVKNARTDKDVVLALSEPQAKEARFSTTIHDGAHYFMARFRPDLQVGAKPQAERRDWVFLFEASGDRDPLLARVQIDVIRHLLHHVSAEDRFTVLTANTRVKAWSKELQPASTENVLSALAFLEGAHLIGALDLGQALSEASKVLQQADNPYLVHLGSGASAMGERRHDDLIRPVLSASAKYVGIGVGRRWNRSFMKAAAERSGGHFTQINPDEQIPWRSFELFAGLNMPRLQDLAVTGLPLSANFLPLSQSFSQGEEVCAVAKLAGNELPEKLVISGRMDGKPWTKTVEVKDVTKKADYLPRTWAKLEIDRLLTEDAAKNKDTIVALSKSMYVMTPFTSLLVLENDDQHVQFKIDFGRKDHWARYACPPKIDIVYEPLEGMPDPKSAAGKKPTAKQVLRTVAGFGGGSASAPASPAAPGGATQVGSASSSLADPDLDRAFAVQALALESLRDLPARGAAFRRILISKGGEEEAPDAQTPAPLAALPKDFYMHIGGEMQYDKLLSPHPQKVGQIYVVGNDVTQDRVILRLLNRHSGQTLRYPQLELTKASLMRSNLFELDDGKAFRGAGEDRIVDGAGLVVVEGLPTSYVRHDVKLSLAYRRPAFALPASVFFDLTSYAPGMANSRADVKAVLEAEARPTLASKPGKIDPQARDLFTRARSFGWQSWTLPAENGQPEFTIVFDGSGKYAYNRLLQSGSGERETASGIRELVTCDGQTLQHIYPLLGIGAQRTVSRFHRVDFADVVPWALPDAADLARGADLKVVAERTVAVVSHQEPAWSKLIAERKKAGVPPLGGTQDPPKGGTPTEDELYWLRIHLVFGADGKLSERQLVKMPKGEIVSRRVSGPDGVVKLFDAKGKELSVVKGKLSPAKAPNLTADTKDLVVLPLPYRTAEHVLKSMKEHGNTDNIRFKEALPLFAAHIAAGNANEANRVFRQVFYAREQRQLGFYVLLAGCGLNLDSQNGDVLAEHLENPVAQYLALHTSPVLRKHASQWAMNSDQWQGGVLQHLGQTHAMLQRWESPKVLRGDPAKVAVEKRRAIEYVKKHKDTAFAWALLCNMQDRADQETNPLLALRARENQKDFQLALAECWDLFKDFSSLQYAARYERARSLHQAGKIDEARKSFREIYEATLKEDRLPPIDEEFRRCMQSSAADDPWSQLVNRTAAYLIEKNHRPAVLALARQVWRVGDQPLAQNLLTTALAGKVNGAKEAKERLALTLAVIDFLTENGQVPQADELLKKLLAEPKLAERSDLWRLAATLADRRDMPARGIECLEKALDLEFRRRSPGGAADKVVVDLEQVRGDYRKLLNHYQSLADAMVALKLPPPDGFLAKVVRSADRWRALDMDSGTACQLTANVLRRLGESDLGWDYLTTPIGMRPNEADPWWELAGTLGRKGELKLADRAYQAAFEAEPTNAQILWDRAQNLRQAGEEQAALRLYRQLAEGTWQPRFQGIQTQARSRLKGS